MSQITSNPVDPRVGLAEDRTGMAAFRTALALDRTTLAWVRTTLGMASFGFSMVAFFRTIVEKSPDPESLRLHRGAVRIGLALIVLGIVASVIVGISYWFTLRRLRRGEVPVLGAWPMSLNVAMLSAIIGLAGLWELFVR